MSEENVSATVIEGKSSKTKNFGTLGKVVVFCMLLAVLMIIYAFFAGGSTEESNGKGTNIAGGVKESALITKPDEPVDPQIKKDIIDKHEKEVKTESGAGVATTAPVVGVSLTPDPITSLKPPGMLNAVDQNKAKKTPVRPKGEGKKSKKKDINPFTVKVKDLYGQWDQATKKTSGVNLYIPQDILNEYNSTKVVESDTVNTAQESRIVFKEKGVDYLRVLPATLQLGYNSDFGDLMIVTVHHKGLEGVRFQAKVSVGAYGERAGIKVTTGLMPDGRIIEVEGVIVDQDDRIPSVKGKVDRHVMHNVVFGLSTVFLDSFARYKELDAGLVNDFSLFPNISGSEQTIDTDGLVVANGADALSRSIKESGSFRSNTLTTKAFKSVGIVFLPK